MHSRHALLPCFTDIQVSQKTRRLALNLQNSSMHVAAPKSTKIFKMPRLIYAVTSRVICLLTQFPEFTNQIANKLHANLTGLCLPKIFGFIWCISFFWIICNSYSSPEFKPIFSISLCKDWRYTVLLSTEYLKVQRHALKACRRKHVAF